MAIGMTRYIPPDDHFGYGTADKVDGHVVFNVGGNKYRLIAFVSYPKGKVYIQHVLTHKEYDRM